MRNGGAAHKNMEAPRNFDSASRRRHPERSRGIFLALRSVSHRHWQGIDALLLRSPAFTHESFISLQERFLDFARNDDMCFLHPKMQCSMNSVPLQTLLTKSQKLINRNTSH